jgi:hypothetical protein
VYVEAEGCANGSALLVQLLEPAAAATAAGDLAECTHNLVTIKLKPNKQI